MPIARHFSGVMLGFGLVAASMVSANESSSQMRQLDALTQLEDLRIEVQSLQGQLEVNQHQLAQLEQRQRDYYDDLNQRINVLADASKAAATAIPAALPATTPATAMPATTSTSSVSTTATTSAPLTPVVATSDATTEQAVLDVSAAGDDLSAYQAAYRLLQNKQYDEAIAAFKTYLQAYPQGEYVANVDYWLGEVYLIQQNYPAAEASFTRVVNQHAGHQKSADALLKLGYVYESAGDPAKALLTLEQVEAQYPGTAVARLAQTKATQIRQSQDSGY